MRNTDSLVSNNERGPQFLSQMSLYPVWFLPSSNLLHLKIGWNLVGISGYKSLLIKDLKLRLNEKVTKVLDLYNQQITELEPGMVYWVKVE